MIQKLIIEVNELKKEVNNLKAKKRRIVKFILRLFKKEGAL
jgi:hypothetical protein